MRIVSITAILFMLLSWGAVAQGPEPFGTIFDLNRGQWISPPAEFFRANADIEGGQNEKGQVLAVRLDLDRDGDPEYLVRTVCGNGGCEYAVFDGRSKRFLGTVFGSVIWVPKNATEGMQAIKSYSHLGASRGVVATYEFSGTAYKAVSSEELTGESNDAFFQALTKAVQGQ